MSKGSSTAGRKKPGGVTLSLAAFEKISAVEGVRLTPEMKRDLQQLDRRRMTAAERTRFIIGKYGKASA